MIRIGGYPIDAIVSEEPTLEAEVTEYPVESGAVITDHTRNRPLTLELEFLVSDTPIGSVAAERTAGAVPSSEARQALEALRASRKPFTVITATKTYESMVFTSLSFPRDRETGDALRPRASLQQISIVEVRRVSIQQQQRSGGHRVSRHVPGQKLWLCSGGVATSDSDAENRRNGCREVVTRDGRLVFADTGEPLGDRDKQTLTWRLTRLIDGTKDDRPPLVDTASPTLKWDPVSERYIDTSSGRPISKRVSAWSTYEAQWGVPPDYTPPSPPRSPDAPAGDAPAGSLTAALGAIDGRP